MVTLVKYTNSNTTLGYSRTDMGNLLVPREFFSQGGLYSWGSGTEGAIGDGSTTARSSPATLSATGQTSWVRCSMKGRTGGAIRSDGTLWTWGRATYGVLGSGSTASRSSPGTTAVGGTNWEEVDAATGHMAAVKNDGTLWTWGRNSNGQLGSNSTTARSSPFTTVGSLGTQGDWRIAAAGGDNSAAIKINGTLWTWGDNVSGQLGDGSTTDRSSPQTVAGGGTNWDKIALSNLLGVGAWAAAIKTDGTLWTWGGNITGTLGDGSTTSRSSPQTTAGGGTNWYNIACGYAHAVATKLDGTLWSWGNANSGATSGAANRSSPETVAYGGTTWKSCSAGNQTSAAIKTDGTLWTWGLNTNGQLGNSSTTSRSSPGTVSGSLLNWTQVSCTAVSTSGNMIGVNQLDMLHFPEIDVYTAPGSFTHTIPEGLNTALIEVWGGGGPGGDGYSDASTTASGGGGGSGGYSRTMANVIFKVGKTMSVTVGAGGVAQVDLNGANSNVSSGTFIVTTMEAGGGSKGDDASISGPGLGGSGGAASGGTEINTTGASGTAGITQVGITSPGGAGAPGTSGRNSFSYGASGTGGTALIAPGVYAGLNGANGAVIITYF
jgi:alpha-tubulin suppressor-like RCC1 family protein